MFVDRGAPSSSAESESKGQRVYEIELDRIFPDPAQPRHLLPYDLREAIQEKSLSPAQAIEELLLRAEQGDVVARLVLGGEPELADEADDVIEDTGLLALARSIQEVGLRQPLNVYQVNDPRQPNRIGYRLGEGERRFWAHHVLVHQGHKSFRRVRAMVEPLPDDDEVIHRRQEAENAARVDLPATARARSIQRIKDRLNIEMGTRVPGSKTIILPSQRELQAAIGQHVKNLTGRAISDRMVRNYLALLRLSPEAQDLAEAGQLTEKQLRPVMRLKSDEEQIALIREIIAKNWSARRILEEVSSPLDSKPTPAALEQSIEEHILAAIKAVYALLALPEEDYDRAIGILAARARNKRTRQGLRVLLQTLEEISAKAEETK
ncbi:MAG TPA: ParB N-terminal domain-containing protein [Anaerolineae bacterium]